MPTVYRFVILVLLIFVAWAPLSCGGSKPPPKSAEEEEDFDLVGSIVGDVEPEELDEEGDLIGEDYTGPVSATINLKVINKKNPKGSFKLSDAEGNVVIKKGKLGDTLDLNQGVYSIEFSTPLVFGKPTYLVEDVELVGKKQTIDSIFPAGQITLHSFRGKAKGKCVPVTFSVKSETLKKNLPGKGKTCKPLILETGAYEVLLNISKKKIQPIKLRINREQMSSVSIKLDY